MFDKLAHIEQGTIFHLNSTQVDIFYKWVDKTNEASANPSDLFYTIEFHLTSNKVTIPNNLKDTVIIGKCTNGESINLTYWEQFLREESCD